MSQELYSLTDPHSRRGSKSFDMISGPGGESSSDGVTVADGGSSSAWRSPWQPAWEAGSLWHLLLRDFSRWRLTFYSAACSTPSSLCQKPSDQLVCWSCSKSQSRDSPSRQPSAALSEGVDGRAQMAVGQWTKGETGGEEAWEMGKALREIFTRMLYFVWKGRGEGGEKWMQFFTFPDKTYSWNLAIFPPWQAHRKLAVMWNHSSISASQNSPLQYNCWLLLTNSYRHSTLHSDKDRTQGSWWKGRTRRPK